MDLYSGRLFGKRYNSHKLFVQTFKRGLLNFMVTLEAFRGRSYSTHLQIEGRLLETAASKMTRDLSNTAYDLNKGTIFCRAVVLKCLFQAPTNGLSTDCILDLGELEMVQFINFSTFYIFYSFL